MSCKVFLNSEVIDDEKAGISVTDSGLLYGAGLFETMRSRNGMVFRLRDHLDRLFFSAEALSVSHSYEKPFIENAILRVLQANELADARLRLTLTNGPLAESEEERRPTLLITAAGFQPYPPEYYRAGVMVVLCPFRANTTDPTYGHQTTSFLPRLLALNMAHQRRAAEALWFTQDGHLANGCLTSVFLVKDSVLQTPRADSPALIDPAGKVVRELAATQTLEMVEKDLTISDLLDADEVFLTNTTVEVLPIVSVERHTVGAGAVGPITQRLREGFVQLIEQECGRPS
jgi:branched-chain amino acid aminotransferase